MPIKQTGIQGLNAAEVTESRRIHGRNILEGKKKIAFLEAVKSLFQEPMVILLLVTAGIYSFSGNYGDELFLAVAIVLVSAISLFQDHKAKDAIEKLPCY